MQRHPTILLTGLLLAAAATAQEAAPSTVPSASPKASPVVRQFVIERDVPGAGTLTLDDHRGAAATSNRVLRQLGPDIQWVHSYVAGDKVYCIYNATSEALIREHAARAGFPVNKVTPVSMVIDPTTANAAR